MEDTMQFGNCFNINMRSFLFFSIFLITFSAFAITQVSIKSVIPSCNALSVDQKVDPSVTFTVDINSSTLTNSAVRVYGSLSGFHASTFNYNSSAHTVTIIPNVQFKLGELVTVTLTRGIQSTSGDSLSTSYSWSFTVKANVSSGIFYQSSTVGVGNIPWDVVAADFDGNGTVDLAVTNYGSNSVTILKNDGTGSFTPSSTIIGLSRPIGITAADFDGDGAIDLAVTNSDLGTVSILKNNGTGIFTISSTLNVGNNPRNLVAVDINGDGAIDLAVPNANSNTVTILKNNGDGTFTNSSTLQFSDSPQKILVADINNDGYLDLIITCMDTIYVLHNNGQGIFTTTSFQSVGVYAATDMDGDGYVDLMAMNDNTNTVTVLKNDGSGSFTQSLSTVNTGTTPWQATAADFDGDGDIDICVGNNSSHNVSILKNNGNGILSQTALVDVGNDPGSITSADLDGNGTIDVIVTNGGSNNISILKNRPLSDFSSSSLSFGSVSVGTSRSKSLMIYNERSDSSLIINNIVSSSSAFIVNKRSLTIAPLECDSVIVTFTPTTTSTIFKDSITITTNDSLKYNATIYLSGYSPFLQPPIAFTLNLDGPVYAGVSVFGDSIMYAIASNDAVYKMSTAGYVAYTLEVSGDIHSSSSIAYDTTVYIASSDKNLYAFSKYGNHVPNFPIATGGVMTATPVVDSIANRLYIGLSNKNFIAVNRTTGNVDWSYFADDQIKQSAVVTADRKLIFSTQKGTLYGFDLNNLTLPATPTWQISLPDTTPSSIALDNQGYVYIGTSGHLLKISMLSGQQPTIVWQVPLGQAIAGSPVIDANGTLYVGTVNANLYAIDIQTDTLKWTFSTKGAIRSTPAISDAGNIFVANDSGEVYSLDCNKNVRWHYTANSAIAAPLLYYKSILYVGTLGNQVIALEDIADSSQTPHLSKSVVSSQNTGKPIWATFQGNNQRTGMFSISATTGIKNSYGKIPSIYALAQNYPNPFNPSTKIQYVLPVRSTVRLIIYNLLGQVVNELLNAEQQAGVQSVVWNNANVASGIYFYRIEAVSLDGSNKRFVETKKMLLLK
jgi:outer membrane protein assembly factor BamB